MKSTLRSTVARTLTTFAFLVLGAALPARAGETLYATGGGPLLSAIHKIDTTTGAATLVWDLPNIYAYAGGLTYDPSTDNFYTIGSTVSSSDSRLIRISRSTGAITQFPAMSPSLGFSGGGLAIHPLTGVMYASGLNGQQSSALFTIDKNTGVPTFVGQCGGQCCSAPFGFNINGLGFRSDGALFANGFTLSGTLPDGTSSQLFSVNVSTGHATEIGYHGINVGRQIAYSDLAFGSNGTLYAMGSFSSSINGLYSINPSTGAATPIGALMSSMGSDGGLVFVPDGLPTKYCTAKTNSQGCVPTLGFSGLPSASSATPFTINAVNMLNHHRGVLLYGYSRQIAPFQNGYLCTSSPLHRLAAGTAGGSAAPTIDCSGSYTLDFNSRIQGGLDPLLVPGQEVDAQYYARDPASPGFSSLSDALNFTIGL